MNNGDNGRPSLFDQEVVIFQVEWFDQNSCQVKKLGLSYYLVDGTVQLIDHDTRKNFLKRIHYPTLSMSELFIGNSINIYGRLLHIVAYGDLGTKIFIEKHQQRGFVLLRPGSMNKIGQLLTAVAKADFFVANLKSTVLSAERVKECGIDTPAGAVIAVEVVSPARRDFGRLWRKLVDDLMSTLGPDALFVSDDSTRCSRFFFEGSKAPTSARFENVTLGLIKPHVTKAGKAGEVLSAIIEEGFQLGAVEQVHLDYRTATEFLDVYKEILGHYKEWVEHMVEGPVIALQLTGEGVVERFRDFVGPTTVSVAKILEPSSLRARYGVNEVKNAVHCTDLPEDGSLECRYFFQLLKADA